MKILKTIGGILLALIAILLIVAFFAAKDFNVVRSQAINAPIDMVFTQVNDLKNWEKWMPWKQIDPSMKLHFEENTVGKGASYSWTSEKDDGGNLTITESVQNKLIKTDINFGDYDTSYGTWTFKSNNNKTEVSWGMKGHIPFPFNVIMLFTDMDNAVGSDFEKGLNNIKELCESNVETPKKLNKSLSVKEDIFKSRKLMGIRKRIKMEDISKFYMENLPIITKLIEDKGGKINGSPFGLFYEWDEKKGETDMAVAIAVDEQVDLGKLYQFIEIKESKAAFVDYYGSYDSSSIAHELLDGYFNQNDSIFIKYPVMEQYVTDSYQNADQSKWLTKVIYMIDYK